MSWLSILVLLPLIYEVPLNYEAESAAAVGDAAESDAEAADSEDSSAEAADPNAETADSEVEAIIFGASLTVASTYVFRGAPQYPSITTPSLQPAAWLDFSELMTGGLRFDVWSAFAMADRVRASREGAASEVDLSLSYEHGLLDGWLVLGGGFYYYIYPGEEEVDGEKELMFRIGLGNFPITPSVSVWFEVHPELGLHIEPSVTWEQEFGAFTVGMDLTLGASIGEGDSGVDHTTFTARLGHEVGHLTMGVSLSYTHRIAPPGLDFIERSLLWGGLSFAFQ
jgi:hypothetical protein